ncbi:MAG: phenylacetate--CoA ligase family protein [Deltaproteobacteria bacterium]|nr:phenylacetate--CoA ligase family protein [Deltaproteobacteria bacterium]
MRGAAEEVGVGSYEPGEVLVPESTIPGLVWPAVPPPGHQLVLTLLAQLAHSQWWPVERLREYQFLQLRSLLEHARKTTRYYRRRLRDVDPGRLTPQSWAKVPLLPRRALQTKAGALVSTSVPREHGKVGAVTTSGSTGMPVTVKQTGLAQSFWTTFTVRDSLWHRRDMSAKLASIRHTTHPATAYPQGASAPTWGKTSGIISPLGPSNTLRITTPVHQQLEWLQRQDAVYLVTYPTNLLHLAHLALARGVRLPKLRGVSTLSEVLSPDVRDAVREAWGVPVHDMYSAQEVGYIALQCPESEHYHVQSEGVLLEVLDDEGQPCAPGEVGRVVVTSLHNFAMPLIRYDLGDFAEVGEPCSCGRGLPVLRRILGRVRNSLLTPGGDRQWVYFGTAAMVEKLPIVQHQLVQTEPDAIELRVVMERPMTPDDAQWLEEHVKAHLPYPFRVTVSAHDILPRSASGKFEDFVCEVEE